MSETRTFDPSKHLTKVGTKDYLQVMWRLVWFRDQHPDGTVTSELIDHDKGERWAMFRATVSIPSGGSATDYGSESARDFPDYIEKASTKAIGRALAALGFGTQFSAWEFGGEDNADRPVDSPVRGELPPRSRTTSQGTIPASNGQQRPAIQNPDAPISNSQLNYIRGLAKQLGMAVTGPDGDMHTDEVALASFIGIDYDADWPKITMGKASEIIEGMKDQLKRQAVRS